MKQYKVFFFFDYDGVLAPIQKDPHTAYLPKPTKEKILKLSRLSNVKVAIVSGRDLSTLDRLTKFKSSNIILIGSHGLEMLHKGKKKILFKNNISVLRKIKPEIVSIAKSISKGFIEEKPYTITYHIRDSRKIDLVRKLARLINILLKKKNLRTKLKVLEGKNIVEIMPKEVSKGNAVKQVINFYPHYLYFYFGDDITDISAFKVVKKYNGTTISLNSKLHYKTDYLTSQSSLINFITTLKIRSRLS